MSASSIFRLTIVRLTTSRARKRITKCGHDVERKGDGRDLPDHVQAPQQPAPPAELVFLGAVPKPADQFETHAPPEALGGVVQRHLDAKTALVPRRHQLPDPPLDGTLTADDRKDVQQPVEPQRSPSTQ